MTIKTTLEDRAKFRGECRVFAEAMLGVLLEALDKVPLSHQSHTVAMIMTELQIATRKADP